MRESAQEKKVHELRRYVKRLRALARLLEQLGARNARDVSDCLGSLGRELSDERDLTVKNKWLEKNGFPELTKPAPRRAGLGSLPKEVKKEEKKLRHEAELISLEPARVEAALKETAKRARRARKRAKTRGDEDDFHRWRKRVRDLVEQGKLLGLGDDPSLERLVKQLGRAQDTVVVREGLRKVPGAKKALREAKQQGKAHWEKALAEKAKVKLKLSPANLRALGRFIRLPQAPPKAAAA